MKTKATWIFPAFISGRHLRVKDHICKTRKLSNSERKKERERKVLAAPQYHQFNLCQTHWLCRLGTYKRSSSGFASKKPAGSVWREESITLWFLLELQHSLEIGKCSYIFKRLSSATGRRGNWFQRALGDWMQRWYSWSLFHLQWKRSRISEFSHRHEYIRIEYKTKKKERRMHKRRVEKSESPHASDQTILPAMRPWWIFRSVSMQACFPNRSSQLGF